MSKYPWVGLANASDQVANSYYLPRPPCYNNYLAIQLPIILWLLSAKTTLPCTLWCYYGYYYNRSSIPASESCIYGSWRYGINSVVYCFWCGMWRKECKKCMFMIITHIILYVLIEAHIMFVLCLWWCTFVRLFVCAHTHTHARTHARMHAHTRTHTHTQVRTCACTDVHTCMNMCKWLYLPQVLISPRQTATKW